MTLVEEKKCSKCKITKSSSEFQKDRQKSFGLTSRCSKCKSEDGKNWRKENPEKSRQSSLNWIRNNSERWKEYCKGWREENREHIKELERQRNKKRREKDLHFALRNTLRNLVYRTLQGEKNQKTKEILGYGTEELKQRIEFNFHPEMTWENYGEWEIDHKIPVTYLQSKGENRPHIVNALSNLQPMWKEENRSKSNHFKVNGDIN